MRWTTLLCRSLAAATLGLALLLSGARGAHATPVPPGGFTLVEATSIAFLQQLNATVIAPAETGVLFGDVFVRFPVTGITGNLATLEHAGGFSLSTGGPTLSFTNFVIDTGLSKLFADVNGSGTSDFPLFDLVPCTAIGTCPVGQNFSVLTGIGLNYTNEARAAILQATGVDVPAGAQFGIVKQVTVPVPEPGTALLSLSGLVGLAIAGRRRYAI